MNVLVILFINKFYVPIQPKSCYTLDTHEGRPCTLPNNTESNNIRTKSPKTPNNKKELIEHQDVVSPASKWNLYNADREGKQVSLSPVNCHKKVPLFLSFRQLKCFFFCCRFYLLLLHFVCVKFEELLRPFHKSPPFCLCFALGLVKSD